MYIIKKPKIIFTYFLKFLPGTIISKTIMSTLAKIIVLESPIILFIKTPKMNLSFLIKSLHQSKLRTSY